MLNEEREVSSGVYGVWEAKGHGYEGGMGDTSLEVKG